MENRKYLLFNFFNVLLVFILYNLMGKENIFLYTISSSLYLILINIFINFSLKDIMAKYKNFEYNYTLNKMFKYSLFFIATIDILIIIITLLLGDVLQNRFNIANIKSVFLAMSISLMSLPMINIISEYLVINKIKIGKYLFNIYNFLNFILTIIFCYFNYKIYKIPNSLNISLIFYLNIITTFIIYIYVYFRYIIRIEISSIRKREEKKLKYKLAVIKSFFNNTSIIIEKMLQYSYVYISLILIYYVLIYQYGYDEKKVTEIINITYLYCFKIVYIITLFLIIKYKNKIKDLKSKALSINEFVIKTINNLLPTIVFLIVISKYIWFLLFGNNNGVSILMWSLNLIIILLISYVLLQLVSNKNKRRILLLGILVKLIITLPLASSFYRLGYSIICGDLLAIIISFLIMIIYNVILLRKKYCISYVYIFDNGLKIIYKNIILCFLLILLQLIMPVVSDNKINSIIIIIIYSIFFIVIKLVNSCIVNKKR